MTFKKYNLTEKFSSLLPRSGVPHGCGRKNSMAKLEYLSQNLISTPLTKRQDNDVFFSI